MLCTDSRLVKAQNQIFDESTEKLLTELDCHMSKTIDSVYAVMNCITLLTRISGVPDKYQSRGHLYTPLLK